MTTKLDDVFQNAGTAIDPVCKMQVDTSSPPGGSAEYQGQTYYFCMAGCRRAFVADPAKYAPAGGGA